MEFLEIAKLFENLDKRSKRLEKVLILRDFLLENKKDAKIVFDILAKNYQREINKKNLGISLKTIFSVISSISKTSERGVEKKFNKLGDLGSVSVEVLKEKYQQSLLSKKLTIEFINKSLDEIASISGTNSNKKKKEILSNLYLYANSDVEYKYLSRLLIDDLRIGVSEGVLREAAVNAYFPNILGIHLICPKCLYVNLNLSNCLKCKTKLDLKEQDELAQRKYQIVELETPKKETSLLDYDIEYEIKPIEFALRRNKEKQILKSSNPREVYNAFTQYFEKKYNLLNSFRKLLRELDDDILNILNFEIILGNPIKSMLGTRKNTIKESLELTGTPAFLDYKYDGLRVQIHNKKGEIELFSRNLDNITKQFPEVVEFIKDNFSDLSFVLDTECVGYDFDKEEFLEFQILSRRILTKEISVVSHINVVVKAFDILYLNGKTLIDVNYEKRREILEGIFINRELVQKLHFNTDKLKD
ncbi:MAG: hypothetical protein PF569_07470 [Candidatus Woesearchaeota archaeon]|jgi:ATP-dependent DNA ligase I|nr:hypothetical protein [Candidatus Woesearchaeota archaeon]